MSGALRRRPRQGWTGISQAFASERPDLTEGELFRNDTCLSTSHAILMSVASESPVQRCETHHHALHRSARSSGSCVRPGLSFDVPSHASSRASAVSDLRTGKASLTVRLVEAHVYQTARDHRSARHGLYLLAAPVVQHVDENVSCIQ